MVPGGGLIGPPYPLSVIPAKGLERHVTLQAIPLPASRTGWRGRLILRPFAFFAPLREPNYFAQSRKDAKTRTKEKLESRVRGTDTAIGAAGLLYCHPHNKTERSQEH